MKKRILSFFITACMVLTMFPTSVFAADINTLLNDAAASSSNVEDKSEKEGSESLPDSGTSTPPASSSVPNSGTSTPAASSSVPNSGTSTPATSISVPNSGTSTPAASSSVPNSGTSAPAASSSVPNSGTSTPAASSSVPNSGTSTPAASSSAPSSSMPKIDVEEKAENDAPQANRSRMMSGVLGAGAPIEVNSFDTLKTALETATDNDIIKLTANIDGNATIPAGNVNSFTIDLNGNALTSSSGNTLTHKGTGTLTVTDSSGTKTGVIVNTSTSSDSAAIYNYSEGAINITGGMISATTGNAIYNYYTGKITISGDSTKITSANASATSGTIYLYNGTEGATVLDIQGGTVENTSTGTAIYNNGQGAINISGGTISAISSSAIYNYSTGLITISGSSTKITSKSTNSLLSTIFLNFSTGDKTVLNIEGGTVENTSSFGNAIYGKNVGVINIAGGLISNPSGGDAIHILGKSILNITDGTISATKGTAITYENTDDDPKITISGNNTLITSQNTTTGTIEMTSSRSDKAVLEITGGTVENTADNGTAIYTGNLTVVQSKVSIPSGSPVIKGKGKAMTRVPYTNEIISASKNYENSSAATYNYDEDINNFKYLTFSPDNSVKENVVINGATEYTSLQEAIDNAVNNDVLMLTKDILESVTIPQNDDRNIIIDLNGKIFKSAWDCAIGHYGSGKLTIKDTSKGSIGTIMATMGNVIYGFGQGTIDITSGKISASTSAYVWNCAVYSAMYGTVNISGGTISTPKGHAIHCNLGGIINITGGKISASGTAIYSNGDYDSHVFKIISKTTISGENTEITSTGTSSTIVIVAYDDKTLTALDIQGGTITNTSTGNAIEYNHSIGKIAISGDKTFITSANTNSGTINLNISTSTDTILEIKGGTIENTSTSGIAIYNNTNGKTSIPSGSPVIKGGGKAMNKAPDLAGYTDVSILADDTKADGSYAKPISKETLAKNITTYKYLEFKKAEPCKITWDDQGAETPASGGSDEINQGSAITIPTTAPTKTDLTFAGWYTEANGAGTKIIDGSLAPNEASVTYYAYWVKDLGTYGGCDWVVSEDNTLTITPTPSPANGLTSGVLPSPGGEVAHGVPWKNHNGQILKVVIKTGVKSGANLNSFLKDLSVCTTMDLSGLDTTAATDMRSMFSGCNKLDYLNLGDNFDTAAVTNMAGMFSSCAALKALTLGENFTTTKVEDMSSMFSGCKELQKLDLSIFNTDNVTNMSYMFQDCYKLDNLNLGEKFTTTNVKDMKYMFYGCIKLQNLDLSGFNTAKVTNMTRMFKACYALKTLTLGEKFATTNVENMSNMFQECNELQKLDLSWFNTAKVTDMSNMFNGCLALKTLDISSFDIGESTSITDMLKGNTFILKTDYYKKAMNSGTSVITLYDKASKADLKATDLIGTETNVKYMPQAITANLTVTKLTGAMSDTDAKAFFDTAKVFSNDNFPYIEGFAYAYPGANITVGAKNLADEIVSVAVVKTGDETTKITVTNNAFTMPAYPVTIDAVVKITPVADDFAFEPTATYDGKEKPVSIGLGPGADFGTITVMYDGKTTAPTDAGTYAITINTAGNATYKPVKNLSLGNFTIEKAPYEDGLTATVEHAKTDKTSKTYDLSKLISGKTGFADLSYTAGTTTKGNVLTGNATVADKTLKYTLAGTAAAGSTATVDVKVTSKNYKDITAKITIELIDKTDVTISGITVAGKTYDDTVVSHAGTPVAKAGGSAVSIAEYDYTYYLTDGTTKTTAANSGAASDGAAPKNAGSYKLVVSVKDSNTTYTGKHADISFTIAKKSVTITGVKADNKVYDGNVTATTNTDATINGKVGTDDVKPAGGKAVFDNKNVGTGKKVTFSEYTLGGAKAANYTLSAQPVTVKADITTATLTVKNSGSVKVTKIYDKTTSVGKLSGALNFDGKIGEDIVSITATAGVYADADAGQNKKITLDLALDGTDKGNYKLASDKYDFKAAEITKTDYSGEKEASELIFATGQEGATLTLPELPKGAKYGTITASGDVEMTDLSIKNNALIFTAPASEDGKTGIVTIKVTDATNYNDYDIVVTITYTAKVNIIWDNQGATTSQIGGSTELNLGNDIVIPTSAPVKTGYAFGGWFTETDGKGTQITATSKAPAKAKVTYYAKWTALKYTITGTVTQENKKPLAGAAVNLIKDGKSIMRTATKPNGEFNLVNVAYGEGYTIKVSKAMYIMQESEKFDLTDTANLDYEVSFKLKELEKIVSGVGENNPFDLSDLSNALSPDDVNVTKIELKVTPAPAVSKEIKAEMESLGKANSITKYYDLSILKYIDEAASVITETNGLVKIVMPIDVDIQGKGTYELLRKHGNNKAEKITTTKNASGEYIEISPTFIVAYLKFFSVYAIQYTEDQAVTPPNEAKDYLLTLADTGDNSYGGGKMNIGDTVKIYAGTKQGYRFIGWETTNGGILADTMSAETTYNMVNGPCTLIARWVAIEGHSGKKNPSTGVGTEVPNNILSIVLPLALISIGGALFIARKHKHN